MTSKDPVPLNWDQYKQEIDQLLRSYYPDYEQRTYLKPVYYISGIAPDQHPLLAQLPVTQQKRAISYFLKEQGRVSRSSTTLNARVWMLKEAA